MEEQTLRLSDDAIVYIRDILTLGLITKTDVVGHLRQLKLTTELKGETQYLVPTEAYKAEYAIVAEQLVRALEKLGNTDPDDITEESN